MKPRHANMAVRADMLGKCYRLGERQQSYSTLRDMIAERSSRVAAWVHARSRRASDDRTHVETIWALKSVSFEVQRGEVVGIIGRNGAGKSTLLKVLSRITEPTEGRAAIHGRVGSLLEVGTGFHPELTGRENVYLNGAILGMRKEEIEKKFDEIVSFAEVEKFVDTPVKRYSSGMYLRLAFGVAAHLEPEILICDEVLSVGDMTFQEKCLGKMRDVANQGRTVLFVSHNLDAISVLTKRALVLEGGAIDFDGETPAALIRYRSLARRYEEADDFVSSSRTGVRRARVITSDPDRIHRWGQPLTLEFELHFNEKPKSGFFSFQIVDEQMRPIMHQWLSGTRQAWSRAGSVVLRCVVPKARMYMGRYTVSAHVSDCAAKVHYESVDGLCPFEVVMDGIPKEYPWFRGDCTYIDDAEWEHM